jgi:hypothetical protein
VAALAAFYGRGRDSCRVVPRAVVAAPITAVDDRWTGGTRCRLVGKGKMGGGHGQSNSRTGWQDTLRHPSGRT